MIKKLLVLILIAAAAGLIAAAVAVRKLPDLAVTTLRQSLGREVSIGSLKVAFPLRLEMRRVSISENAPFKGETAFSADRIVASIDPWEWWTARKVRFTHVELDKPVIIFRKTLGKTYHAFRIRPAHVPEAAEAAGKRTDGTGTASIPPLEFDHVEIRDGEARLVDYDTDQKGFVVRLLRVEAQIAHLEMPAARNRIVFDLRAILDQGREHPEGRVDLEGDWRRDRLDGRLRLALSGVQLPYFAPYYRAVTPSEIADGELNVAANARSTGGVLEAHSKWTLRRLEFGRPEPGDLLIGFDANLIRNILAGDDGVLDLDLELAMDLRDRTVPFREALLQSLRRSVKATFLSNFDSAVRTTVDKIADRSADLLREGSWKDLIKKKKIQNVVNEVMNAG